MLLIAQICLLIVTFEVAKVKGGEEKAPEEHLEDWEQWGEWKVEGDSKTRDRKCKSKTGPCRGYSSETISTSMIITNGEDVEEEHLEDWEQWGEWVVDGDTKSRERKCKSKTGPCRGYTSESISTSMTIINIGGGGGGKVVDDGKDHPEDWEQWGEWVVDGDTKSRERKCKSKTGPCRGFTSESISTSMTIINIGGGGKVVDDGVEHLEDWEQWGEWVVNGDNKSRERKCKKAAGPCRGFTSETISTHVQITEIGGIGREVNFGVGFPEDHPEDFEPWGEWEVVGTKRTRRRKCLNPGGVCRGFMMVTITTFKFGGQTIEIMDDTSEHPEDWGPWSEWVMDGDTWTSKRECLNPAGQCRGFATITIKATTTTGGEIVPADGQEHPEDWSPWGAWEMIENVMTRKRQCVNPAGPCRGFATIAVTPTTVGGYVPNYGDVAVAGDLVVGGGAETPVEGGDGKPPGEDNEEHKKHKGIPCIHP